MCACRLTENKQGLCVCVCVRARCTRKCILSNKFIPHGHMGRSMQMQGHIFRNWQPTHTHTHTRLWIIAHILSAPCWAKCLHYTIQCEPVTVCVIVKLDAPSFHLPTDSKCSPQEFLFTWTESMCVPVWRTVWYKWQHWNSWIEYWEYRIYSVVQSKNVYISCVFLQTFSKKKKKLKPLLKFLERENHKIKKQLDNQSVDGVPRDTTYSDLHWHWHIRGNLVCQKWPPWDERYTWTPLPTSQHLLTNCFLLWFFFFFFGL